MGPDLLEIQAVSAVTLGTHDMVRAVAFYAAMGFDLASGGAEAGFTSLWAGPSRLNLVRVSEGARWGWWGRIIFHVDDVDAFYARALDSGFAPEGPPADAPWGERYFHLLDPDGHELSFARPLR